jgi:hypothetical protein
MQKEDRIHESGLAHEIGDVVATHADVRLVRIDDGGSPGSHGAIMPSAGAAGDEYRSHTVNSTGRSARNV